MDDRLELGGAESRREARHTAHQNIENRQRRHPSNEPGSSNAGVGSGAKSSALGPTADGMFAIELHTLLGHLQRYLALILTLTMVGASAAIVYGWIAPQRFTVTTEILVDPANLQVVSDDLFARNEQRDALLLNVESKMRVLISANVLARVVTELNLASDAEFVPLRSALAVFSGGENTDNLSPDLIALRSLRERVKVSRDEKSFAVTLSVTTGNPEKSVAVSRAIYASFQADLAKGESEGAGRAASSLMERLVELKSEVNAAEERVEFFKSEHGLQSHQGELISTLSLTQLSTQVLEAERRLIEAQSRYNDLSAGADEDSAAAQQSATFSALRTQFASLKQEADALGLTLGPRHPKMQAISSQVQALVGQLEAERGRIVTSAKSDLEQAQAVLASLKRQSSEAQLGVVADNSAQVQLRELQRDADAKAAIYEAFLMRARQVAERESIDTTNVRVISEPVPPKDRSWPPRTLQLAALGAAAGLAAGALLALVLGLRRGLRT